MSISLPHKTFEREPLSYTYEWWDKFSKLLCPRSLLKILTHNSFKIWCEGIDGSVFCVKQVTGNGHIAHLAGTMHVHFHSLLVKCSKNVCISLGDRNGAAYVPTKWMPWRNRLFYSLSTRRHLFNPRSVHMGIELNTVKGNYSSNT